MTRAVVVTGTDTGVGKTVFAAGLAAALGGLYWKPVQAGIDPVSDTDTAAFLGARVLPEVYSLTTPASPHLAARIDGVTINPMRLALPQVDDYLVAEGAGGVLVPLSETLLYADVFATWGTPVILCARTGLGTINHSLLSIDALRARGVPVLGIVFIGEAHEENERIVPSLGKVLSLGRLPMLDPLTPEALAEVFADTIDMAAIRAAL
ncbi:ATP-dependent dethiobiotin synthetase BioD [Sphingobium sp. SCG-1]|uniref:dethiobiotin synthase n=1 Tax=Sphingobium sp. SCG-1 TaxID=2072936 RepID=UPI000CD6781B|nr:dethiobiotin synthase [Sphingobium sp. SCG-1]AUW57068.1 ATP-dependent dethiobiotin synthetase BioD [Sphingobium sp. SCG-1]